MVNYMCVGNDMKILIGDFGNLLLAFVYLLQVSCSSSYCAQRDLRVVCSGGAACKCDPTRIRITTLNNTKEDELCKAVKQRVKALEVRLFIIIAYTTPSLLLLHITLVRCILLLGRRPGLEENPCSLLNRSKDL